MVSWLGLGDSNSKSFHVSANIWCRKNFITCLRWQRLFAFLFIWHQDSLHAFFFSFFLFSKTFSPMIILSLNLWPSLPSFPVTSPPKRMIFLFGFLVRRKSVKLWGRSILWRPPGPDGFNAGFFIHFWDKVKPDIMCMTTNFFLHKTMDPNHGQGWNTSRKSLV